MKNYLVELTIYAGEFEKSAIHLTYANNQHKAIYQSFEWESHGDLKIHHDLNYRLMTAEDDGFEYSVSRIKELTQEQADQYNKITNFYAT